MTCIECPHRKQSEGGSVVDGTAVQGMGRFESEVHPCHMDAVKPCRGHARDLVKVESGEWVWNGDRTRNNYTLHGNDGIKWESELNHEEIQEIRWMMAGSGRVEQTQRLLTLTHYGLVPIPEYERFTGQRYEVPESPLPERDRSGRGLSRYVPPSRRSPAPESRTALPLFALSTLPEAGRDSEESGLEQRLVLRGGE